MLARGPDNAALSGPTRLHQTFQPIDPLQRLAWRQGVRIEILQRFNGRRWLDPLLPIVVLAAIMLWVRWQAQGIKDKLVVKD
ncbi:hypothetical protein N4Q71_11040 [Salmonella enterica subsp. enterica serovar Montevideo]